MKAIVQVGFGSPDVLALRDVDRPSIDGRGILVKVHAAAVNALDWHVTRGMPYVVRIGQAKESVRGIDVAGRVVATGKDVTRFKTGDAVFGGANGSFAEYAATTEDRLALKPLAIDDPHAAAMHIAGLTALQGLRDKAGVKRSQSVLINGAGGGVGTFAVQIAKWLGAEVTAVTRTESVALVRSLGAGRVIDHELEDFTRLSDRYDTIFDIGGNRSLASCRRILTRNGTMVVVGGPAGRWIAPATRLLKAAAYSPFVSQRFVPFISQNDSAGLELLGKLAEEGSVRAVIDREFALEDAAKAIAYVGSGHARGKVVLRIA